MSVIIFYIVNLYVDFIDDHYSHLGCQIKLSGYQLSLLQYTDDSCLVANSVLNSQTNV